MTAPVNFYADFKGLSELRHSAAREDPNALREAARQFESVFTQMMLKSMREANASMGDSMMDNEQSKFYTEMFDNQLAVQLSKGKGLGLAEMLVRQISPSNSVDAGATVTGTNVTGTKATGTKSTGANATGPNVTGTNVTGTKATAPNTSGVTGVKAVAKTSANLTPVESSSAMTPDEFVRNMWQHAQAAGQELGVDPQTLVAHAALETGWGKHIPRSADGSSSFNLFGIKTGSHWQGASVGVNTVEYEHGVAVRKVDSFRAYESPAASFRDYAALLKNNSRYQQALGAGDDAAKFGSALQAGGYATDPNYAQKLAKTVMSVLERVAGLQKTATTPSVTLSSSEPSGEG